ncbi:MAG TPA: alpha/beta hydrolase [Candidatus Baltobacteraceae bacterium]|jgi:pimeloyl-ACP methyl ester carboxylesterase
MRAVLTFLCVVVLLTGVPARAQSSALGLHLKPCGVGKAKVRAECGTFGVYENRTTQSGRVIALHLIVIPAAQQTLHAITEIAGGPGEAATDFAPAIPDGDFGKSRVTLRETYDYLFVDSRGMGTSHQFRCNFAPSNDPAAYFRYLYPPALVAACRAQNATTHDMTQYNHDIAVDDLDEVRAALGYEKLVLDGGSDGTLFALDYMRRHPERVESAILDGVAPPGFQPVPGEPMGAQRALDDLFVKCRTNAACKARFPHFAQHFAAVLKRFDAGSIPVPAKNVATKKTQTVALSKEVFVDSLRHIMYDPFGASFVPYVIERAYVKDYAPLGRMMQSVIVGFSTDLNMGAFLTYSCADWMPFISKKQIDAAKAHSFAGDLRFRAQQRACSTWKVPVVASSFAHPVHSDVPVLMILGSDDPATPARYGLEALKYLPNGKAVLVKGGGHGADTPCTDKLVLAFVKAKSAKGLKTNACSATFRLPPFATSMKSWP